MTRCLCILMIAVHVAAGRCAAAGETEVRLHWKAFEPGVRKEFFQELATATQNVFKISDTTTKQKAEQTYLFRWSPKGKDDAGNWLVGQEALRFKLAFSQDDHSFSIDTDDRKRPDPLASIGNELLSSKLSFTIGPGLEIKEVTGHDAILERISCIRPPLTELLKYFFSRDATVELLEPTLAAFPPRPVKKGVSWKRRSELSLGALGTFTQDCTFTYEGKEGEHDRVAMAAQLTWSQPPEKRAAWPFKVKRANFKEASWRGFALFDRKLGRFVRTELSGTIEGEYVLLITSEETHVRMRRTFETKTRTFDRMP